MLGNNGLSIFGNAYAENSLLAKGGMVGRVFYVDGVAGSSANSGSIPTEPLDKIESALDLCTDGGHNYIFVTDYYASDTFPITVDKTCVHIIGMGNGCFSPLPMSWCAMVSGAHACFEINATSHYCEIAGFQMGANASNPCVLVSGGVVGVWIHHNSFGTQTQTQDGIYANADGDLSNGVIEHNVFGSAQAYALSRDGYRVDVNSSGTIVRYNYFNRCGGVGVDLLASSCQPMAVHDNWFYLAVSTVKGSAITTAGQKTMFYNNHAMMTGAGGPQNPYLDTSTGSGTTTLNGWGVNYRGIATTYPVFA